MTEIRIIVPGKPVGKGRPRFAKLPTGRMVAYTPEKTRSWESIVRASAQDAMGERERFECPVAVAIRIYCEVPQSWPEWKRAAALAGRLHPTTRPDLDNCVKLFKDAANGVCWRDDCQVTTLTAVKLYSTHARMEVTVAAYEELLGAQSKHKAAQQRGCGRQVKQASHSIFIEPPPPPLTVGRDPYRVLRGNRCPIEKGRQG